MRPPRFHQLVHLDNKLALQAQQILDHSERQQRYNSEPDPQNLDKSKKLGRAVDEGTNSPQCKGQIGKTWAYKVKQGHVNSMHIYSDAIDRTRGRRLWSQSRHNQQYTYFTRHESCIHVARPLLFLIWIGISLAKALISCNCQTSVAQ